jgi:exoribonuclease-2
MYALFEEAGKFQTGRVMSEAESSAQIELESGKRVKVKSANVLLKFDKPNPTDLLRDAQALSVTIELELAWEFAPEDEFGFADLAREYFNAQASITEQAAALFRLYEAPHYFRRAGKGRFKKAPAEIIAQALAAIEKKKQIQAQIESWAHALAQGQCPEPIQSQLYKILFKPDKNAPEYKAVVEAARHTQTAPLVLLQKAGAIQSAYQFHWQRFLFENFPKGTGFPALQAPAIANNLPLAQGVRAYSIDDSQTTEIDDALSVQGLGSGSVTLGIHIAAPALAIQPGDAIDQLGRQRLSTVYMPGYKITMLPDNVVQTYTLQEGRDCPAVSLYVTFDEATLTIQSNVTRVERVPIAANLRHDQLDTVVTWPSCFAWLSTSKRNAKSCGASLKPSTVPTTTSA